MRRERPEVRDKKSEQRFPFTMADLVVIVYLLTSDF
jgi:hypothetical protein